MAETLCAWFPLILPTLQKASSCAASSHVSQAYSRSSGGAACSSSCVQAHHLSRPHQHAHGCTSLRTHSGNPLIDIAQMDPGLVQDVLVGGAVTAAVSAALLSGLKKESEPCDLCRATGGIQCFACAGTGNTVPVDVDEAATARPSSSMDMLRRTTSRRACRVCKGVGLLLCKQCKGAGYTSKF